MIPAFRSSPPNWESEPREASDYYEELIGKLRELTTVDSLCLMQNGEILAGDFGTREIDLQKLAAVLEVRRLRMKEVASDVSDYVTTPFDNVSLLTLIGQNDLVAVILHPIDADQDKIVQATRETLNRMAREKGFVNSKSEQGSEQASISEPEAAQVEEQEESFGKSPSLMSEASVSPQSKPEPKPVSQAEKGVYFHQWRDFLAILLSKVAAKSQVDKIIGRESSAMGLDANQFFTVAQCREFGARVLKRVPDRSKRKLLMSELENALSRI